MKKLVLTTTVASFIAMTSFAGDLSEPIITDVEEPEAASSSAPWLVILLIAGTGLLIATQDDD